MDDIDFKQAAFNVSGVKCRRILIKLEVIPCGDGEYFRAVHSVMTSKDLKNTAPEKVHPAGCCTCRRWTLILGVVTTCLLGAIVITLAIMSLEYFQSDLERISELRGELISINESRDMNDNDCGQSQLPKMDDIDFKQAAFDVSDEKCRQTRIKLEVIPCGDGEDLRAVHSVYIENDFVYYLVNDGGKFKERIEEKQAYAQV
ncbi:hypothetical protein quinque_006221 [Culex quinquefasciatus]